MSRVVRLYGRLTPITACQQCPFASRGRRAGKWADQDACYCNHSIVSARIDVDVTKAIPDWCSLPEAEEAR